MNTLHSAAASVLPRVFTLQPQDVKSEICLAKSLGLTKRCAEWVVRELTRAQVLARAFDGLRFGADVVELHRHLPERSGSCTLGHNFTLIQLPGDLSIRCEHLWRPDVDPKQIKGLRKILKVHVKDRVEPKRVEIAKNLRQEDIDALEKAYTAAYRGIEPAYQMGWGHRDAIRKVLPELLACRIKPKQFRPYVFFVFETYQRITGQVIAPVRMLASVWYVNAFKNDLGIVETMDTLNAHRLLRERGYKGPTTDVPVHMCERMLEGVSADSFAGPGFKPEAREAAIWLYENMELVGAKEVK